MSQNIDQKTIKAILKKAVNAPSGHNEQPWRFEIQGEAVYQYNLEGQDDTMYNFREWGSYIAHGALLQNISILAREYGLRATSQLFPKQDTTELVAKITFQKNKNQKNTSKDLVQYIENRATNRKPYQTNALKKEHIQSLQKISKNFESSELQIVQKREEIKKLARAFGKNEQLIFENYAMHQSLFPYINWTLAEEKREKEGLYIETMELPSPVKIAFKIFKHWKIINFLQKINLGEKVAQQNEQLYAACGAVGLISIHKTTPQNLIEAGQFLQQLWLEAEKIGISMQPLGGVIHLGHRVISGDTDNFNASQQKLIKNAFDQVKNVFNVKKEVPILALRLGYDDRPTAHSLKKPPKIYPAKGGG